MWNTSDLPPAWLMNASFEKMKTRVGGGVGWGGGRTLDGGGRRQAASDDMNMMMQETEQRETRRQRARFVNWWTSNSGTAKWSHAQGPVSWECEASNITITPCHWFAPKNTTAASLSSAFVFICEGKFFFLSFFQLNKISWHGSFASERRNPSRESNHSFLSNFWKIVFVSVAKKKKKENGQYVPLLKRVWRWTRKAFFCLFPTLLCQNLQWKVHEEKPRSDPRVLASHLPFWHVEQVQACQLPLGLEMWQICQKQRLLDLSRLENGPAGCASTSEASAWFVFQSSWGCLFVVDTKPLKLWSICMWEAGTS